MTQIINRFNSNVICEGETSLRELVLHYVKTEESAGSSADLSSADLRSADLRGADLRGAYLSSADLSSADLSSADLSSADLRSADLRGADLSSAYLRGVKIKTTAVFTGLYQYIVMPVIAGDGTEYVRMGCHFRKVSEWNADFWNNPSEFPNNGDIPSKLRWMAYQTALQWLEINREARK